MITITMNTARLKLKVEGHAMPAEDQNELDYIRICSAASALAQGLAYAISTYNGGKGAMKAFDYRPKSGDLLIKVFPETWAEREIRHMFEIYGKGFQLLAESHPQSVTYIKDGERIIAKGDEGHE